MTGPPSPPEPPGFARPSLTPPGAAAPTPASQPSPFPSPYLGYPPSSSGVPSQPPLRAYAGYPPGGWAWNGYQWAPVPYSMPYGPPARPYEPMRTKATIAAILYVVAACAAIFVIVALLHRYSVVTSISDAHLNGGPPVSVSTADDADNLVIAAVVAYVIAAVVAGISLLVVLHGSQRNNRVLGAYELRYTPGWVVGWSLIPLVNFVMHWLVVSDVERTSRDPRGRPTRMSRYGQGVYWAIPALVTAWITSFVLQLVGNGDSTSTTDPTSTFSEVIDRIHTHDAILTGLFAFDLVIIALYIVIIRRILANQERAAQAAAAG